MNSIDKHNDDVAQSVAIPFIMFTVENGFQINPEAAEFISQLKGKVGVISICGKYRTGKSYILNKLFMEELQTERKKKGFNVGPTINPCTKGLWIWKEIFYAHNDEEKETPIIIIDTEGLGAFDEDDNHDTKIFLLGLLMCSFLIYNSVGSIDENVLNNLSLVVNLSKSLQISNDAKAEDPDELAEYFPAFLWILRDFALRLIDQDGNTLTQKQYLEGALKEQKGTSDAVENKNRIRRLIKHFFKDRDCQTLVRPVEDEKQLQNLNQLQNSDLRVEFVDQITALRTKIFKKVKPKTLRGQIINGPMLVELAEAYVKSLNGGKVPTIENAWNYMQVSELERAQKEVLTEFDQKINTSVEKLLPLNGDQLKEIYANIKNEAFTSFSSKLLGDISNNAKGQEYLDKIKKQFKVKYDLLKKKNIQVTKDNCISSLDISFNQNIKSKMQQGLYKNYSELKIDLEKLRTDFIQANAASNNIKEFVYEYLFNKSLAVTEDLISDKETNNSNQLRLIQEQLKSAESDSIRYKQELTNEKETSFKRIQDTESDRIKLKTENMMMHERLTASKTEVEELRAKVNGEYATKLNELERQNKMLLDEIRQKDKELRDFQNQQVHHQNDQSKRCALLEQERDYMKNDLQNAKDTLQRKEQDYNEAFRASKEKDEKMKKYKSRAKQAQKEFSELKSSRDKSDQEIRSLQQQLQMAQAAALTVKAAPIQEVLAEGMIAVDEKKIEQLKKDVESMKLERVYLQSQLTTTQSQKDENKRLYETLLNVINNQQQMNGQNKENTKGASSMRTIATSQEIIERLVNLQQKNTELEQTIQLLRMFKNLYKSASEIKCLGCSKSYKPVIFKGHYLKCSKLDSCELSLQESKAESNGNMPLIYNGQPSQAKMHIKVVDSEQGGNMIRFYVNIQGIQWYVKVSIQQLSEVVQTLAKTYPKVEFFGSNLYRKFLKISEDIEEKGGSFNNGGNSSRIDQLASTIDVINKCLHELTSLYVMRKDAHFKQLFEVDEHSDDKGTIKPKITNDRYAKKSGEKAQTRYVNFMSQAKASNGASAK